jgi:hypothetical protein
MVSFFQWNWRGPIPAKWHQQLKSSIAAPYATKLAIACGNCHGLNKSNTAEVCLLLDITADTTRSLAIVIDAMRLSAYRLYLIEIAAAEIVEIAIAKRDADGSLIDQRPLTEMSSQFWRLRGLGTGYHPGQKREKQY